MEENSLLQSLIRIESKQDTILYRLDQQAEDQERIWEKIDATDSRVAKVEKKLNWYTAYFAGIGATLALVYYAIKSKFWQWLPDG